MNRRLLVAAVAAALLVPACAAQSQAPRVDEQAASGQSSASESRDGTQGDSQSDSQSGSQQGVIVRDADDNPHPDDNPGSGNGLRDDDPDADDNLRSGVQLPADFPIPVPDEYEVQAVGTAGDETSVILRVPSGEDAYYYYRQTLAQQGFRVEDEGRNQGGFFEADLEFSDNMHKGGMEFDGDRVEVEVERHT